MQDLETDPNLVKDSILERNTEGIVIASRWLKEDLLVDIQKLNLV